MARLTAIASGNLSNPAIWGTITNTPTIHASTNLAVGAPSYTATFTAPNTTNYCVGVWVMQAALNPTTNTYYVTLQENSIDTTATVTVDYTVLHDDTALSTSKWYFFKFATPYKFTSTTAGYYRFKIGRNSSSTNWRLATDSGGSLIAFMAVDDRTATPTVGDDLYIGGWNGATPVTVTVTGTQSVGSGTDVTGSTGRTIGSAITVTNGGTLIWDTTASASLTVKGNVLVYGASFQKGRLEMGNTTNPYPAAYTASLYFNENLATQNYGLETYYNAQVIRVGASKTQRTSVVSGLGTAASPLVVADSVSWAVGDLIMVAANSNDANNYLQSERKYIRTVVSATQYTLANTLGGAESALTYTHSIGAIVANLTCNVVVGTSNVTYGFYEYHWASAPGDLVNKFVYFLVPGGTGSNGSKYGIVWQYRATSYATVDYCVFDLSMFCAWYQSVCSTTETYTGNIFTNNNGTYAVFLNTPKNKTYDDFLFITVNRYSIYANTAGSTFNRTIMIGSSSGSANGYTAISFVAGVNLTLNDIEIHCTRGAAIYFSTACINVNFNRARLGTKGYNAYADVWNAADVYVTATFTDCVLGSPYKVEGNTFLTAGSTLIFVNWQNTTGESRWYTNAGYFYAAGTALADTITHTAGGYSVSSLSQTTLVPNTWVFKVPTGNILGKTMTIGVWCYIANAAYWAGTHTQPYLSVNYDNGTVAYAYAAELAGRWMLLPISFTPTTSYGQVTVTLGSRTDASAANAPVYFDDFVILYPAGYQLNLGNLDLWADGQPVTPPISTNASAMDVWTALTSTSFGTGTMGELLKTVEKKVDDNQALIIGV